jgi:hypothetical protein
LSPQQGSCCELAGAEHQGREHSQDHDG